MIEQTIEQLIQTIQKLPAGEEEKKQRLLKLVESLKSELLKLSPEQKEKGESLSRFTSVAIHEVLREEQEAKLRAISIDGLEQSAEGFEASHPNLAALAREICRLLASIGI